MDVDIADSNPLFGGKNFAASGNFSILSFPLKSPSPQKLRQCCDSGFGRVEALANFLILSAHRFNDLRMSAESMKTRFTLIVGTFRNFSRSSGGHALLPVPLRRLATEPPIFLSATI